MQISFEATKSDTGDKKKATLRDSKDQQELKYFII